MRWLYRVLMLTLSLFLLCSCAATQTKPCEDIALGLCAKLELPTGQMYCKNGSDTAPRALPEDTVRIMYGNDAERIFGLLEDYAIYLCAAGAPYEAAVFKCHSASDSDSVAAMCLERADELSVLMRDTEYADIAGNARVISRGKYTVMVIAPDPQRAEEIAKDLVG